MCVFSARRICATCTYNKKNELQLFVSIAKPYKNVSKDTIARWMKHVMSLSGINISVFKPHSTRAVSTSKTSQCSVPITYIMSAASWVADSTFHKFYKKNIGQVQDKGDIFGHAISFDATRGCCYVVFIKSVVLL